ncbi:MAG: hypothetical protein D6729_03190 [Deltaproteobacteria bacterium]|nr:MAG: hypothetical protein D6729_03190 [Deltaproteobacteria bacterium]
MSKLKDELVERFKELTELAVLDEGDPQSFRVRAYENATYAISGLTGDIAQMSEKELVKVPGIGPSTAKKIREYVETGRISKLEALRKKYPPEFVALTRIPGLGPKKVLLLRDALGIRNLDDLKAALEKQEIRHVKGMGEKTEENIRQALLRLGTTHKERRSPIAEVLPVARRLVAALQGHEKVREVLYCGSLRRFRETIGDVDIVAASEAPREVMAEFVGLPEVKAVLAHGDTKSSVLVGGDLQVDLRVVPPRSFGAAVLYFTGSKAHNVKLRARAQQRGWTLNEYALTRIETGRVIAARSEEAIYRKLGMPWIPPPMREDTGEIEAAESTAGLPEVVRVEDLKGDLSLQGDGLSREALEALVTAAKARGLSYAALLTSEGSDGVATLRRAAASLPLVRWIGAEVEVGDGGEIPAEAGRGADFVVARITHRPLEPDRQTQRLVRAIADPRVRIVSHLCARRIGESEALAFDVPSVLDALEEHRVALAVSGELSALDAPPEIVRAAMERRIRVVLASEAATPDALERLEYASLCAQRGWCLRDRVLNTESVRSVSRWLSP